MNKVRVKNLHFKDLEVLQLELDIYNKYVAVKELKKDFYNSIITFDIISGLMLILLNRIWKGAERCTISFSTSQAAIILKCCNFNRTDRNTYTKHVMTKLSIDLHKQLTDLV